MAAVVLRRVMNIGSSSNPVRYQTIHTTPSLSKIVAGRHKTTKDRSKPLTYEEAHQPTTIGHRKSWNSWNTTTLQGGMMKSHVLLDDVFIRKFVIGTFHGMICSEIIIKRQHNIIRLAFICTPVLRSTSIAFLVGYTEEMLGYILQCPIKLEPTFIRDRKAVIYKYV